MVTWYWSADTLFWQVSINHNMEVPPRWSANLSPRYGHVILVTLAYMEGWTYVRSYGDQNQMVHAPSTNIWGCLWNSTSFFVSCFRSLFLPWPCTNHTLFLKDSQSKVSINLFTIDLFGLYILFSQYRSCDNTQKVWSFVLSSSLKWGHASMNMPACTLFNEQNKGPSLLSIITWSVWENRMYKPKRSIHLWTEEKRLCMVAVKLTWSAMSLFSLVVVSRV